MFNVLVITLLLFIRLRWCCGVVALRLDKLKLKVMTWATTFLSYCYGILGLSQLGRGLACTRIIFLYSPDHLSW
jgi:hypothetical protein